ncbi:pyridoxal-phosphate dependent enzyme [Dactylosporangium sp. NPDC050588]|uniref:pyridoxal-phosphate dependent enzyme n=1 Tax=Dactylosporangium sp. NPDC050588 TaxID=3157211 RepID=UPI0034009F49
MATRSVVQRGTSPPGSLEPATFSAARIGNTPLVGVRLRVRGHWRRLWLKLEHRNPGGSIKDRTAYGLLVALLMNGQLRLGRTVVESTSGNLGIALAYLAREWGFVFVAVLDPKVPPGVAGLLERLGARLDRIDDPRGSGFYLRRRLARVQELLCEDPDTLWTNQYGSPANPRIHFEQTGPEILRQFGVAQPGAVFAAVSTGGTLAGIGRYMKVAAPRVRVVGVDMLGSAALGGAPGNWLLNGIGAGRRSEFLRPTYYDDTSLVGDREAIAVCHVLGEYAGLLLGGSSGAVIAACTRYLAEHPDVGDVVCVCPDGADRYYETIYDSEWLAARSVDVTRAADRLYFDELEVLGEK